MEVKKIIKTLSGKVVSTSMTNTIVVSVETKKRHPLLEKVYSTFKKYKAHTSDVSKFGVGDLVTIVPCRPISKFKRFIVQGESLSDGSVSVSQNDDLMVSAKVPTQKVGASKTKKIVAKKSSPTSKSSSAVKKVKKNK